ncbi:metal-dependent phosphohydrolase [Plantactinospora sp. GCM10030261]|uniref:HD domain-containing protein n=1 Tax=Plantactinospora sp. GCM10030261 TaxID=3273420 RepID=UPI003613BF0F
MSGSRDTDQELERWCSTIRAAAVHPVIDPETVAAAGNELLRRWREPHRHYHTADHLTAVLSTVDEWSATATNPDLVRLAAWCHDAVYDPRAAPGQNERDSAALASVLLTRCGLSPTAVDEVRRLVLLTDGHQVAPGDRDGELLCDADLAVLAAEPNAYDRYARAIRREYGHLPEASFRAGRSAVLRHLLDLPALYRLPGLAARWTAPARANLARELAELES